MAQSDPFKAYLRVQRQYDARIMRLLERAAKDAQRLIITLDRHGTFSAKVRANQLRVVLGQIRADQRSMWASIGDTVQAGRKDGALAAQEGLDALTRIAYAGLPPGAAADLADSLALTARSGIESAYARKPRALSSRVYGAATLATGQIEDIIQSGLAQGLTAKEFARTVYGYISPTTPGGASYAAMRLARTEINNAFHERQIAAANAPGVSGVQWNLSGSHPRPDECNALAERDNYRMGAGVYPPNSVPGKPHPHCFCYLSYVSVDPEEFAKDVRAGKYDAELRRRYQANLERLKAEPSTAAQRMATKRRVTKARKVTKPTAKNVDPKVTLTPNQLKREAARRRQKAIDDASAITSPLSSLAELAGKKAAADVMRQELRFLRGLTPRQMSRMSNAIDAEDYDAIHRLSMEVLRGTNATLRYRAGELVDLTDDMRVVGGHTLEAGTKVRVVQPGQVFRYDDEEIWLEHVQVRRLTDDEVLTLARARQADINYHRDYAQFAGEFEELIGNQVESDVMFRSLSAVLRRINRTELTDEAATLVALTEAGQVAEASKILAQIMKRLGIRSDGVPGTETRFNKAKMQAIGGSIPQGAEVLVVRPGYYYDRGGETIQLSKMLVEE
jgi:hypothetical protein